MGKWQNIPPNEKPNWHRMNEGQRRYAYEQYNLALVRRGLQHNHPVPENQGTYNHRGDFDIDSVINRPHPDEHRIVEELDNDDGGIKEGEPTSFEEAFGQLPDAAEDTPQEFDESLFESDNQGTNNTRDSDMADSSVITPKRGSSGQGGSHAKRLFQGEGSTKLPGTAAEQGGNNMGEDSVRPFKLPKPIVSIQNNVQYFRKVHRFYTYGFAYKVMALPAPQNMQFMTTPLALVPWDWLHFYVNPSEFALLPLQSSVRHLKCTVFQRNVRTAFQTNSTNNALATLNQNKNIIYSVGLNKKVDYKPRRYDSFGTGDQSMVPMTATDWTQADFVNDMNNWYGSQANTSGAQVVTPRHQMGQPDRLYYYANLIYRNVPGSPNHDGWECLQTHIEEADADVTAGGKLVEVNYSPKVGICKRPKTMIQRRLGDSRNIIPRGSHVLRGNNTTIDTLAANSEVTNVNDEVAGTDGDYAILDTPVQQIEKSQLMYEGLFMHPSPEVQPTLHVGVQPVYAFTATDKNVNAKFQDTQAYFEVVAEAWIDTNFSTFRPLTQSSNVKIGNYWRHIVGGTNYGDGCIDGLQFRSVALPP